MANLEVITKDEVLVIDSRLIAEELGIQHKNLRQTIEKYLTELQGFGTVTFETIASKMPDGRINPNPERFCYLNENQATFLMTLSRNTEQVVKCKVNLVNAFFKAKELITTQSKPDFKPLPSRDIVDYIKVAKILPDLQVNPLLKQLLEDGLTDELELFRNQKLLTGDRAKKEYTIVKVRARELKIPLDKIGNGAALGAYVAKYIKPAFKKRVGGFEVNHFEVSPRLDEVINSYFR